MAIIREIKQEPRNIEVLDILAEVTAQVQEQPDVSEIIILVRGDDGYKRFASKQDDLVALLGTLRLMEYDILRRMEE